MPSFMLMESLIMRDWHYNYLVYTPSNCFFTITTKMQTGYENDEILLSSSQLYQNLQLKAIAFVRVEGVLLFGKTPNYSADSWHKKFCFTYERLHVIVMLFGFVETIVIFWKTY